MSTGKLLFRLFSFLMISVLALGWIGPVAAQAPSAPISAAALDPTPPSHTVKLIFIHHSTGDNWLSNDYGNLGKTLGENNYFVSDTHYGWGPNSIGDRTDIPNWTEWFRSADTPTYMSALYSESEQRSYYTRTLADPGGTNQIIMFKSCFPNSALEGNPNDPPSSEGWLTVGHAKYVYNEILQYFGAHPEKLFIVITAPPLQDGTYAANARAFNQWLVNDWLDENNYTKTNVAVFDFYNVLTGPNNHHRYISGAIEHVFTPGMNTLYYPSGDDHPSDVGSQKATDEFVPWLNVQYHRWSTVFSDVSVDYWAAPHIVRLYNAGVTGGCLANPLSYCPETFVNRAQMAVFLLRSMYGNTYTPSAATGTLYADVPVTYWAAAWIEALAGEGITGGCGDGNYCPETVVTRDQMAVFLLRARHGNTYTPPIASGSMFGDVPSNQWAARWIEALANEGITGGCGGGNYCPATPVNRAQMAVFLVVTFNLP